MRRTADAGHGARRAHAHLPVPPFRGRKGADLLLELLESEARLLGASRTVLNTRLDLVEARGLYVRHGYREIPAYCTGPYMEIWYGKDLSPTD